ncbi:MAG: FAD-dependent oxidoreductase [Bacteroidota bacterium]
MKRIAIIGGGISGISNAYHLTQCKYQVTLYEKHSKLGGVWANGNSNKTSKLQTPSFFYYFMWKIKWKSRYPYQPEILANIDQMAEQLTDVDVRLNTAVESIDLIDDDQIAITTDKDSEPVTYDGCIIATGLHQSFRYPDFNQGSEVKTQIVPFNKLDTVDSYDGKKVAIVGLGASGVEAYHTAMKGNPRSVQFIARSRRWIFPDNKLYGIISYFPFAKANQWTDRYVHKKLRKHYAKHQLTHIMPATSPAMTGPGSISGAFFDAYKPDQTAFFLEDQVTEIDEKTIKLASGKVLEDVDILVLCTGWSKLDFSIINNEDMREQIEQHMQKGYLYMHEFIPGYNHVVFSNFKSGLGSTGFAPQISSLLLQNYLEQKRLFPSKKRQEKWVQREEKKWAESPNHFQFINMFEPILQNFLFFAHPLRTWWFFAKLLKNR